MPALDWIALTLVLFASAGLFATRNWRWNLISLAVQYAAVFWFVQADWGPALAAVKVVTGWMICAALGLARRGVWQADEEETSWPQGRLFRLAAAGIAVIIAFAASSELRSWLGLSAPAAWGALLLIAMGLLLLGVSAQPFRVVLGLLTALSGFEVIYAAVESSVLVAGLLAAINLGLALAGAHFLSLPVREETP
jgi:hypothetical protein